jgi:dihydrofolate reductase
MFDIILAIDDNYGIGKSNTIPWKCTTDMKFFKSKTINNILIVGRKTWESMPQQKILVNRIVIVVSTSYTSKDVHVVNSFSKALTFAYNLKKTQDIFVIGGAQIYNEAFQHCDLNKLYVTYIHGTFECDTFLNVHVFTTTLKNLKILYCNYYNDCTTVCHSKQPFS